MKFSVGDLVILKGGVIRDLRDPKVGIVLDFWHVEHIVVDLGYNTCEFR
jgi:hypothetical protein